MVLCRFEMTSKFFRGPLPPQMIAAPDELEISETDPYMERLNAPGCGRNQRSLSPSARCAGLAVAMESFDATLFQSITSAAQAAMRHFSKGPVPI